MVNSLCFVAVGFALESELSAEERRSSSHENELNGSSEDAAGAGTGSDCGIKFSGNGIISGSWHLPHFAFLPAYLLAIPILWLQLGHRNLIRLSGLCVEESCCCGTLTGARHSRHLTSFPAYVSGVAISMLQCLQLNLIMACSAKLHLIAQPFTSATTTKPLGQLRFAMMLSPKLQS
jgi:hypothetical protein